MLDASILTEILAAFINGASQGFPVVQGYATALFNKLIIIQLVVFGIGCALGHIDFTRGLIAKIMLIGFVQLLLFRYVWLIDNVRDGFVKVGLSAAGGKMSVSQFLDPSFYVSAGFEQVFKVIGDKFDHGLWTFLSKPGMIWVFYGLGILALLLAFIAIGLQIFLSMVEFYLVASLAIILLPFLIVEKTNFLGLRALNSLLTICIKLMVIAFVAGLSAPIIELLAFTNNEPTIKEALSLALGAAAVALIMWRAPGIALNMISGSGGLDVNSSIIQPITSAVNSAGGTARFAAGAMNMGNKAASAVSSAASEGVRYVRNAIGK